jgi:hypothetical protein
MRHLTPSAETQDIQHRAPPPEKAHRQPPGGASRALRLLPLLLLFGGGCGSRAQIDVGDRPDDGTGGSGMSTAPVLPEALPTFPNTGINATTLTVTGMKPSSGPFSGGNQAIVRGSGFTDQAIVHVGGRMVQPADTILRDRSSLMVVLPAGDVGLADVRVTIDEQEVTRPDAYRYNPLLLEPVSGSTAGGTLVTITTSDPVLQGTVDVHFGSAVCTGVEVVTPSRLRCKSPEAEVGLTDVNVRVEDDDGSALSLQATDAFEYIDLTDTDQGGLGGGPVDGTLNITVVDSYLGLAVVGAFVLVGDELDTDNRGLTNKRGQITFSGDDVEGPLTVHVAAKCMERASIVAFDARNVTVYLNPLLDPSCGKPGDGGGGGRGTAGSLISGELIFPGSDEFLVNDWDSVPDPRPDELRVAYVFTTRLQIGVPNPAPNVNGAIARIVEDGAEVGARGYPYTIFARPAGLAVYAISGLERRDTGEFIPYLMGVARDVLTAPGTETQGVDIEMTIPLDRELQVSLANLPQPTARGPEQFRVQAHVDLGGEGVIVRQVNGQSLDVVSSWSGGSVFRFFAQPALLGALADARYQVIAGYYTGEREDTVPYTETRRMGVAQLAEPLVIDDLLAIPKSVDPEEGASLPSDRVLRWSIDGTAPDLWLIEITGGDNLPAWTQLVPGALTESSVPDLSSIEELSDISPGVILWSVRAVRIDGFDFDELKYNQLSPRFWSHTSIDTFTMQR